MKAFEWIKKSKWEYLLSLYESNLETQVIFSIVWVANQPHFISFYLGSINNILLKVTRHRVMGDGCIWEGISLMDPCSISQPVFLQVKLQPVMIYLKENNDRNNIPFKKVIEKVVLLQGCRCYTDCHFWFFQLKRKLFNHKSFTSYL